MTKDRPIQEEGNVLVGKVASQLCPVEALLEYLVV